MIPQGGALDARGEERRLASVVRDRHRLALRPEDFEGDSLLIQEHPQIFGGMRPNMIDEFAVSIVNRLYGQLPQDMDRGPTAWGEDVG
jgi:hypothetical protein